MAGSKCRPTCKSRGGLADEVTRDNGPLEKIMSKSNNVSTLDHHTLADSELDAVTGGLVQFADVRGNNNGGGSTGVTIKQKVVDDALGELR
jgi:hypothetical protein